MKYFRNLILFFTLGLSNILTAQVLVKGKIVSSIDKEPMIGVVVLEKNSSNASLTDINGEYSITLKEKNAVLVAKYMGYKTFETTVNDQSRINIEMEDQSISLNEVVAIGYGESKRKDLTGSVS
jgi:hypothetical protein